MIATDRLQSGRKAAPDAPRRVTARRPYVFTLAALAVLAFAATPRPVGAAAMDGGLARLSRRLADPAQASQSAAELPDGMVSLFVQGDVNETYLRSLGGDVGANVQGLSTVRVPAAKLSTFLQNAQGQSAQLAQHMDLQTITSVPQTGATSYWTVTPTGVFSGLTGKGVIIGIIDTGVDFRQKDFKTTAGKTRILDLWDQTVNAGTHPTGFTYGTEWTAAQIDAGQCTFQDGSGHGTFVAGIAAGNGQATIPGQAAYRYVGMAPEADIIVVNAYSLDTYYVDAVKYVFQKAQARNEPAVCVIAAGKRTGPHDGTDSGELAIANLMATYGPNRLVVAAAGNYGASAYHASVNINSGTSASALLTVPITPTGGSNSISIDGWYKSNTNFSVSVKTPKGTTVGPVARGGYADVITADGEVFLTNGTVTNAKGDYDVSIAVQTNPSTGVMGGGIFTITGTSVSGSGPFDLWMGDVSMPGTMPAFTTGLSYAETVVSPATGDSVISVGAYTYRTSWVAASGTTYGLSGAPILGDIASWSGHGFRRDGGQCPDVCAAGQAIGSSRSTTMSVSGVYILPDSVHVIQTGTSVAAAHVAGAIALQLESYKNNGKNLSAAIAKQWLRSGAQTDAFVTAAGVTPNAIWGSGKLHINPNGTTGVEVSPSYFQFAMPFPSPSRTSTAFEFALGTSDQLAAQKHVGIELVDVSGRIVQRIPGAARVGLQRLAWNGKDESGSPVGAGVYFARLVVGDRVAAQKFVRLAP